MSSNDILAAKPRVQLWGLDHLDRMMGDPLRTVVGAQQTRRRTSSSLASATPGRRP